MSTHAECLDVNDRAVGRAEREPIGDLGGNAAVRVGAGDEVQHRRFLSQTTGALMKPEHRVPGLRPYTHWRPGSQSRQSREHAAGPAGMPHVEERPKSDAGWRPSID